MNVSQINKISSIIIVINNKTINKIKLLGFLFRGRRHLLIETVHLKRSYSRIKT